MPLICKSVLSHEKSIPIVTVPSEMGRPREDQMQGPWHDQLAELAGRVCYNSMGAPKSRPSADFHANILDVGHLNVYEHPHFISIADWRDRVLRLPGVWCENNGLLGEAFSEWRVFNKRTHLEHPSVFPSPDRPFIAPYPRMHSFFVECSRWCSHELIRHRRQTAVSQESTRFVSGLKPDYSFHPLSSIVMSRPHFIHGRPLTEKQLAIVALQLHDRGCPSSQAKKQINGLTRHFAFPSPRTRLIFSASTRALEHIIMLRLTNEADAEIRALAYQFLRHLHPTIVTAPYKTFSLSGFGLWDGPSRTHLQGPFYFHLTPAADSCGLVLSRTAPSAPKEPT